jgi:hypothetical protein
MASIVYLNVSRHNRKSLSPIKTLFLGIYLCKYYIFLSIYHIHKWVLRKIDDLRQVFMGQVEVVSTRKHALVNRDSMFT